MWVIIVLVVGGIIAFFVLAATTKTTTEKAREGVDPNIIAQKQQWAKEEKCPECGDPWHNAHIPLQSDDMIRKNGFLWYKLKCSSCGKDYDRFVCSKCKHSETWTSIVGYIKSNCPSCGQKWKI